MQRKAKSSMMTAAICAGLHFTAFAAAQSPIGPTVLDPTTPHHVRQYQLMKDMTEEMSAMTEQMSRSDVTAEQRKRMAQRMSLMSYIMCRMSGLEARPAMKEAESERQMNEMRKQMDEMKRQSPGEALKKPLHNRTPCEW